MNLLESIDRYCERTDASWWSEPVNALTNLAFVLAAWWLLRRQYPADVRPEVRRLAVLLGLIGVCSGIFHVSGTVLGAILDVASIALFILFYLFRFLRRVLYWQMAPAFLAVLALLGADRAVAAIGSLGLNGSESYIPPWLALVMLAFASLRQAPSAAGWLFGAALLFLVSFSLRVLDMQLCAEWPLGTHFGWHVLNAAVLYLCVRGLAAGCRDRL
ncbi:hypothetical protein [Uliginosibacterium sp. H1]|uniref:hypothetical protein n=1 Tax=Uliginosibacterium sp. H1 TaxID=3114757 RepID=UPI002E181376|nr:hypothetical protein [Uliginosibacterium sp. H1]